MGYALISVRIHTFSHSGPGPGFHYIRKFFTVIGSEARKLLKIRITKSHKPPLTNHARVLPNVTGPGLNPIPCLVFADIWRVGEKLLRVHLADLIAIRVG
jgi:hypothetical protein